VNEALKLKPDDVNILEDEYDGHLLQEGDLNNDDNYDTKPEDFKFVLDVNQTSQNPMRSSLKKEQHLSIDFKNAIPVDEYRKVVQENAELKERELKYAETIRHLKNQIDQEKKNARSLRADKVNFMMQRNELEEFFLQCIEEVRKDIVKRKSLNQATQKKNMLWSASRGSLAKESTDDELPNAKLEHFTATDKRKVIELLMSNENVLLFLYEKLFPATNLSSQSTAQSRMHTNTAGGLSQGPMSAHQPVRFTTDSGVPIGLGSATNVGNGRSQTSVGGSRLNVNRANLNSLQNYMNP